MTSWSDDKQSDRSIASNLSLKCCRQWSRTYNFYVYLRAADESTSESFSSWTYTYLKGDGVISDVKYIVVSGKSYVNRGSCRSFDTMPTSVTHFWAFRTYCVCVRANCTMLRAFPSVLIMRLWMFLTCNMKRCRTYFGYCTV